MQLTLARRFNGSIPDQGRLFQKSHQYQQISGFYLDFAVIFPKFRLANSAKILADNLIFGGKLWMKTAADGALNILPIIGGRCEALRPWVW